jgi:hypothetical protein
VPEWGHVTAGHVFQATLRVNAADRSQAFASIDGLSSDILIKVLLPSMQAHGTAQRLCGRIVAFGPTRCGPPEHIQQNSVVVCSPSAC